MGIFEPLFEALKRLDPPETDRPRDRLDIEALRAIQSRKGKSDA